MLHGSRHNCGIAIVSVKILGTWISNGVRHFSQNEGRKSASLRHGIVSVNFLNSRISNGVHISRLLAIFRGIDYREHAKALGYKVRGNELRS